MTMLKELIYEMTRGVAYRKIKHPEMWIYRTLLPLVGCLALLAIYICLPVKPVFIGPAGIIPNLLTVISTLPGFYFAGLAAVATFQGPGMDTVMEEPAPKLPILVKGEPVEIDLTRRQFLTHLFAYLVIISFILCLGLLAMSGLAGALEYWQMQLAKTAYGPWLWCSGGFVFGLAFLWLFCSMLVTTLHGIYFLTDRMHRP
jgi:hypothetical protein